MYRKLHFHLSLLCAAIITVTITAMTIFSLYLIWDNQRLRSFQDFQKSMERFYETLMEESTLSHVWLNMVSEENGVELAIWDNGRPLLYGGEAGQEPGDRFRLVLETAEEDYGLSRVSAQYASAPKHVEFELKTAGEGAQLVSVCHIPKDSGLLSVAALSLSRPSFWSLRDLWLPILLAAAAAVLLLCAGSILLVWRMIRPLRRNRQQQIRFFAEASHELRSPLAVILTALPGVKSAQPERAAHFYDILWKESRRMQRLVNDMFTLASLDNGAVAIRPGPVSLDNLLIESYEKFQQSAAEKGIHISFRLPEAPLPQTSCDGERMAQVFTILLDNALSYTPKGGEVQVELSCVPSGGGTAWPMRIGRSIRFKKSGPRGRGLSLRAGGEAGPFFRITVSDSGPGIPPQCREEIFHRFYRCDTARTDKDHSGLGLCIAKEILELHGGSIRAEDSPLGGARFTVLLPGTAADAK